MKVAVATERGRVAPHFGHCPQYTIAEIQQGNVVEREVIDNPGHQPGFLPGYLAQKGVDLVVAGGMGQRARDLFQQQGIATVVGVEGAVEAALGRCAAGDLRDEGNYCAH